MAWSRSVCSRSASARARAGLAGATRRVLPSHALMPTWSRPNGSTPSRLAGLTLRSDASPAQGGPQVTDSLVGRVARAARQAQMADAGQLDPEHARALA